MIAKRKNRPSRMVLSSDESKAVSVLRRQFILPMSGCLPCGYVVEDANGRRVGRCSARCFAGWLRRNGRSSHYRLSIVDGLFCYDKAVPLRGSPPPRAGDSVG